MSEQFQLRTPQIRANCVAYISQLNDPDTLVVIKNKRETRSSAQHSLKWIWCRYLAKERAGNEGWSAERWNRYFKGLFIRPLLISQDDDYHEFFSQADRVIEAAPDETAQRWAKSTFLDAIKTEWLNVKNMAEFMTLIDRYCLDGRDKHGNLILGVRLPVPDDLKYSYQDAA